MQRKEGDPPMPSARLFLSCRGFFMPCSNFSPFSFLHRRHSLSHHHPFFRLARPRERGAKKQSHNHLVNSGLENEEARQERSTFASSSTDIPSCPPGPVRRCVARKGDEVYANQKRPLHCHFYILPPLVLSRGGAISFHV